MEAAISTLVGQFKAYAGKDGSDKTLSKKEFHDLLTSELPGYAKKYSTPADLDKLMGSLDQNGDGELTFLEFWQLIGNLASEQAGFGP